MKSGKAAATIARFAKVMHKLPAYLQLRVEDGCWWDACVRYAAQKYVATPKWADTTKTNAIYREAARRRATGENVVVDHLVPLNHPHVCGLHWHENLRIIGENQNQLKSNYRWPDGWLESFQLELDEEPHQLRLDL